MKRDVYIVEVPRVEGIDRRRVRRTIAFAVMDATIVQLDKKPPFLKPFGIGVRVTILPRRAPPIK